jgi:hypothetical protein
VAPVIVDQLALPSAESLERGLAIVRPFAIVHSGDADTLIAQPRAHEVRMADVAAEDERSLALVLGPGPP